MIQYTGEADEFKATIILFGDGLNTSVNIDLTRTPFNVKFASVQPNRVIPFIYAEGSPKLDQINFLQGKLLLVFDVPLPDTPFIATSPANVVQTRLEVYFIYQPAS